MAIEFFDASQNSLSGAQLREVLNGRTGEVKDVRFYIKNNDPTKYYSNLSIVYRYSSYNDSGVFGTTGWGVKFCSGTRQPTESEWNAIVPGISTVLPDIGNSSDGDTLTYYPVWARIICPAGEPAQIRDNGEFVITATELPVVP
jgi:hypothetical protein